MTIHSPVSRAFRRAAPREQEERTVLDAQDWFLLRTLLRFPFLSRDDLTLSCAMSHATLSRRFRLLHAANLVEAVTPPALTRQGARPLYHLSNRGLHAVAAALDADPAGLARVCQADERGLLALLPRLPQLVRLQDVIAGLVAGAPAGLGGQDDGREMEACGEWNWARMPVERFLVWERARSLRVDGVVAFHVLGVRARQPRQSTESTESSASRASRFAWRAVDRWHVVYLLGDTGARDPRDVGAIRRRIETLLAYRERPDTWVRYASFPPVLVLAETPRSRDRWLELVRSAITHRGLPPLIGAIAVVPSAEEMGRRDPWRIDWVDLTSGAPVRLAEALRPTPREALPLCLTTDAVAPIPVHPSAHLKREIPLKSPTSSLVQGHFMERARRVALGLAQGRDLTGGMGGTGARAPTPARQRARGSASQRAEERLLALWAPGRLLEVLDEIVRGPGIKSADLALLTGLSGASLDRYVRALRQAGLVTVERQEKSGSFGSSGAGLALSVRGTRLDDLRHERAPARRRTVVALQRDDLRRDLHDAGVYHFFALLTQACARVSTLGQPCVVGWWETGALIERTYRQAGRWRVVRPDGEGKVCASGRTVWIWLEWDRGTMSRADLARKFAHYAGYVASAERLQKDGETLPLLLVVVEGRGQFERLRRAAAQIPMEGELAISATYARLFEERGPLAPIWWPIHAPVADPGAGGAIVDPARRFSRLLDTRGPASVFGIVW